MAKRRKPTVDLHGPSRRDFIKYSVALGASLGLPRWKIFEVAGDVGGTALADEISCNVTNRSVHIIAGSAGFAWFQLLWPQVDVALANNPLFAFHDPKNAVMATGTDRPILLGPQAPWKTLSGDRQLSVFMSGKNEFTGTHTDAPTNSSTIDTGKDLFAACATMQTANPTLVPVITVDAGKSSMPYRPFAAAPQAAEVASADAMTALFESSASSAMGPLGPPGNGAFFEAYYKGFLGLNAAANRPTYARGFLTGKLASRLVGVNLSSQLKPTAQDLARYGCNLGTPSKLTDFATTLITTANAFKLGLTSCVILPAFNDDPHAAFADMTLLTSTVTTIGAILDAFLNDLNVPDPSCAGTTIAHNLVLSIHTDTPKTPLVRAGWPDDTPGNNNWTFVLGAGWLRTGWFGGILRDGTFNGFDPTTGKDVPMQPSSVTAMPGAGAIAYAVAKGDARRVGDFYRGVELTGITRLKIT